MKEVAICAVSDQPDRLHVFGVGTDNQLYHKSWNGSAWLPSTTGWEALGGILGSAPAVASWGPNRLDVFALGADFQMYHKAWNGTAWEPPSTGWDALGGTFNSPPAVASWGPDRLDIFALGTDNQMYHKAWSGSAWLPSATDWDALGGTFNSSPVVGSSHPNRLDVFALGTDDQMYHRAWDTNVWLPSTTDWEGLGGEFFGPNAADGFVIGSWPAMSCWNPSRLDIFGIGTDFQMYHKAWANGWLPSQTGWEPLGGLFESSPVAVSWAQNRIDAFAVGADDEMCHIPWDGNAWILPPERLGGTFNCTPAVTSWGPNRLDIFGLGADAQMYHKAWAGSWLPAGGSWTPLGGTFKLPRPTQIPSVPAELTFQQVLTTPSPNALGSSGPITVQLRSDGTYTFSGHMHDSGFDPYDFRIRAVIQATNVAIAAQVQGHTDGTSSNLLGSVNRDFQWNQVGGSSQIAANWASLQQATMTIDFHWQDVGLLNTVEEIAQDFVNFAAVSGIVGAAVAAIFLIGEELLSLANVHLGPGGLVGVVVAGGIIMIFGTEAAIAAVVAGVAAGAVTDALVQSRTMNPDEYNFANAVFAGTLPQGKIVLTNMVSPLGGNRFTYPTVDGTTLVNLGSAYANPTGYSDQYYSIAGQVFIHELTHAWQIAHNAFVAGFICVAIETSAQYKLGHDVYLYGPPKPNWTNFGVEQQAHIVDDWFAGTRPAIGALPASSGTQMDATDPYFQYIANNIRAGISGGIPSLDLPS